MSVCKDWLDVIRAVLILLEAIIVIVWMDMSRDQIITLVQVNTKIWTVFITLTLGKIHITYKGMLADRLCDKFGEPILKFAVF